MYVNIKLFFDDDSFFDGRRIENGSNNNGRNGFSNSGGWFFVVVNISVIGVVGRRGGFDVCGGRRSGRSVSGGWFDGGIIMVISCSWFVVVVILVELAYAGDGTVDSVCDNHGLFESPSDSPAGA